jgi:hypothetical protein
MDTEANIPPAPPRDAEVNVTPNKVIVPPTVNTATAGALEPPPLPFSLRDRKKSIIFFWFLFVFDCTVQPLGLYFGLWYGTNLSHNLGMYSLLKWPSSESDADFV